MALLVGWGAVRLASRVEVRAGAHAAVRCVAQLVDVEAVLARSLRAAQGDSGSRRGTHHTVGLGQSVDGERRGGWRAAETREYQSADFACDFSARRALVAGWAVCEGDRANHTSGACQHAHGRHLSPRIPAARSLQDCTGTLAAPGARSLPRLPPKRRAGGLRD